MPEDNETPQYDNEMRGALFPNDKRGNPKAPDMSGRVTIAGVEYRLAGWKQKSRAGQNYLSLAVSIPQAKDEKDEQNEFDF